MKKGSWIRLAKLPLDKQPINTPQCYIMLGESTSKELAMRNALAEVETGHYARVIVVEVHGAARSSAELEP